MRLLLLIFALVAAPALARDLPPDEPTYEQPKFERPEKPEMPPESEEEDDEPRVTPIPPATNLVCPEVKCVYDENGDRIAVFSADVPEEMHKMGAKFCKYAPEEVAEVTACCLEDNGVYKILYNVAVSDKAHYKATRFCTCVHGLD